MHLIFNVKERVNLIFNILTDESFEDDMVDPACPPVTGAVAGVAGEAAVTAVPVG